MTRTTPCLAIALALTVAPAVLAQTETQPDLPPATPPAYCADEEWEEAYVCDDDEEEIEEEGELVEETEEWCDDCAEDFLELTLGTEVVYDDGENVGYYVPPPSPAARPEDERASPPSWKEAARNRAALNKLGKTCILWGTLCY
jgi:hypothetical protein